MVARRRSDPQKQPSRRRPATTPEGREIQLISRAVELAEERMRDGTASAQEIVHFLRLGSSREKLEQARLAGENQLLQAKIEAMASAGRIEELYKGAIDAMRSYTGQAPLDRGDDLED